MFRNRLAYYEYNAALSALMPAIGAYYVWTSVRAGLPLSAVRQQVGLVARDLQEDRPDVRVWIQAASVGEAVASAPVIHALKILMPATEITLSTMTKAGNELARSRIPETDNLIYFPLDIIPAVRKSLSAVGPTVFVLFETEIWPNFIHCCRGRGVPVVIINGIISDRAYERAKRVAWMYRWALSGVERLCMQSETDAERAVELGADPNRVEVVGNCKFDQLPEGLSNGERARMLDRLCVRRDTPIWVAGSTNPGEEEMVLDAHRILRQRHNNLALVIAPRQLGRVRSIGRLVESRGFSCGWWSQSESLSGGENVIILDTMGELASLYGVAKVAFVGGSLVPKGGHNILQPIAHGRPVIYGPHTHKTRDLVRSAGDAGVGFQVADSAELAEVVGSLLEEKDRLDDIHAKALALVKRNRGASHKCAEVIAELCTR